MKKLIDYKNLVKKIRIYFEVDILPKKNNNKERKSDGNIEIINLLDCKEGSRSLE